MWLSESLSGVGWILWIAKGKIEMVEINNLDNHEPLSEVETVWRYLSFDRYIYLITSGKLWFSRIDKVGDEFEGSVTHSSNVLWRKVFEEHVPFPYSVETIKNHEDTRKTFPKLLMANCWHGSRGEEMMMWKIYTDRNGIAIKSSVANLSKSLADAGDIFLNRVNYRDYSPNNSHGIFSENLISQASSRPDYLSHEKEVRLTMFNPGLNENFTDYETLPSGIGIPVDIRKLISQAVIRPGAEKWVSECIEKIHSLLGFSFEVKESKYNFGPVW